MLIKNALIDSATYANIIEYTVNNQMTSMFTIVGINFVMVLGLE
jgi:hypothetical protein